MVEFLKLVAAGFIGAVFAVILLTTPVLSLFGFLPYFLLAFAVALALAFLVAWAFRVPLSEFFD